MPYKELSLDRDKIDETIKTYPNINIEGPTNISPSVIKYIVCKCDEPSNKGILNVHLNKGTVSFSFQGKNMILPKEIADCIKEKCTRGSLKHQTLSFGNVSDEDFQIIKEYLVDECKAEVLEQSVPHGHKYSFTGKNKDSLTAIYYQSKKLVIQGKQQFLFTDLIEILCQFVDFKSIIEQQLKTFEIPGTVEESIAEFKELFPSSYSYLGQTLVAVISPSLTFRKINISLTDYSSFVFPILRGLEGFLKKILDEYSIKVSSDGFLVLFDINRNKFGGVESYSLKPEYNAKIKNSKISSVIVNIYIYFKQHRHGLFHVDQDIENTKVISNKNEADSVINKAIEIIEESFVILKNENKNFGKSI
jgi:hypothetical protein